MKDQELHNVNSIQQFFDNILPNMNSDINISVN
jgi:hypothetical protein